MRRCIITPTYSGHFKFIKKYLRSFDRYLLDRNFPIYFIISSCENIEFENIIKSYKRKLNINIIFLEDVFKYFNIDETPSEALELYGRLSFQTLKKLYSALYINYDQFLFIDSESMLVKETNMNDLFDNFFSAPKFFISKIENRTKSYKNSFVYEYINAVSSLFGKKPEFFAVESYEWFYDLNILKDLINNIGDIIDIIRNYELKNKFPDLEGILEALLYYQYIYENNEKYKYKIYIVEDELKSYLGNNKYYKFISDFNNSSVRVGGILEFLFLFVDESNYLNLSKFISDRNFSIMRVSNPININNVTFQRYIIEHTGIKICPSEQSHYLGINRNKIVDFLISCQAYEEARKAKRYSSSVLYSIRSSFYFIYRVMSIVLSIIKISYKSVFFALRKFIFRYVK